MYLKFRYELGYEVLVDEVKDSIQWRRFCRIALDKKVIRGRKLRVDTTAVEADIHDPTDASILSDGIRIITRTVKKIKELGAAVRTDFRDRQRSVKNRILSITKVVKRRTGESYAEVRKITGEIMETAKQVVSDAQKVVTNTKQYLNRNGDNLSQKIHNLVQNLKESR